MKKRLVIFLAILVAVIIYGAFDPSVSRFFPRCPFYMLTGLKCPGCGSQRAIHSLLHGDVSQALSFNLFLVVAIPLIAVLYYAEYRRKSHPRLYMLLNSKYVIWTALALVCGWWLIRNILGV